MLLRNPKVPPLPCHLHRLACCPLQLDLRSTTRKMLRMWQTLTSLAINARGTRIYRCCIGLYPMILN